MYSHSDSSVTLESGLMAEVGDAFSKRGLTAVKPPPSLGTVL